MTLDGRVAMVTGGASGIGEAIAVLFAAQNADVVVADVDSAKGEDVVARIRSAGGRARFVELNVAGDEAVGAAVDRVVAESGALDVMVNNAGINGRTAVDQSGWWRLLGVNLLGVAWGTRHAVRVMRQAGGGVVLNTGSHAGQRGHRTHVYGASKAAVHTLTRYTALRHGPDKVRANAIVPGNIYTGIYDMGKQHAIARYVDANAPIDVGSGGHSIEDGAGGGLVEEFERLHPMGRRAEVSHIAAAAAYLASDEAEVVTGNEFMVTGGLLAPVRERRLLRSYSRPAPPDAVTPAEGSIALLTKNGPLGAAIADCFAARGIDVVVPDSNVLGDEESLGRWVRGFRDVAGLVYAMAPDSGGDLLSQAPSAWREQLNDNFRVPWALAHTAEQVLPPGGSVTFVADTAGLTGEVGSPAFCAAAAALIYSTDDLADVLRPTGVRLNTVVAELTSSPLNRSTLGGPASARDVGEVVYTLCRGVTTITGAQISLETSHPEDG